MAGRHISILFNQDIFLISFWNSPLIHGSFLFFLSFFFFFLGLYLWLMEVPRLGVESELQLLSCATATAIPDGSHVCDLHHSSWQRGIYLFIYFAMPDP